MIPSPRSRRIASLWLVTATAALLGYAVFLSRHASFAVGGADSSGYANAAKAVTRRTLVVPIADLDRFDLPASFGNVFTPLGYVLLPGGRTMAPMYPVGFPLHFALAGSLFGWEKAPYLVSPLAAVLCVILMYALGRELGLSGWLAAGGAVLLASCPVFVFQAVQPMSDVTATLWILAAVFASLKAHRDRRWAAAAGFAAGVSVLVRPLDLLVLLPLALALPLDRRRLVLFVLGGIPPAALFFAYNNACFGSPFETGYSMTGHWHAFGFAYFPTHFPNYLRWTAQIVTPVVFLGWLALPFDRHQPGRVRALLGTWFAVFLLVYSCYLPGEAWWYTRFLLPGVPAVILAFLLILHDVAVAAYGLGRQRVIAGGVAAIVLFAVLGFDHAKKWNALDLWKEQAIFPRACLWAAARLPAGAVVISSELSGALRYYTRLQPARWEYLTGESFGMLRERISSKRARLFALLRNYEIAPARPHLPGNWLHVADLDDASLWALE